MSASKLYVGNLPYDVDEAMLQTLFAPYGQIKNISLIVNRSTGGSKGFAFVAYWDDESAQQALALDGAELEGRNIVVNIAMEKERRRGNRLWRRR